MKTPFGKETRQNALTPNPINNYDMAITTSRTIISTTNNDHKDKPDNDCDLKDD